MNEPKWCTCAEFNAKTEANAIKHNAERAARGRRYERRRITALRRVVLTVAVDAALVGVIAMAVVVLLACGVS